MKPLRTFLQEDGSYRYTIQAPDFVVDHEERPHYEKDRFLSMEANIWKGEVLFDVGSELGWQSAIYAQFGGPANVCLFEHTAELWPTIRETWEANHAYGPLTAYCGFVSNRSTDDAKTAAGWPPEAYREPLKNFDSWSEIHADSSGKEITLDDFAYITEILPSAITIDVEGAEYRVLTGALELLREVRPLVWLSLHPDKRLATFETSKKEVMSLLRGAGYAHQYLGVDHEEHYFFYPEEFAREVVLVDSPWGTNGKRNVSFEEAIPGWEDTTGMPYAKCWGTNEP